LPNSSLASNDSNSALKTPSGIMTAKGEKLVSLLAVKQIEPSKLLTNGLVANNSHVVLIGKNSFGIK
jgi:hypothetical protein